MDLKLYSICVVLNIRFTQQMRQSAWSDRKRLLGPTRSIDWSYGVLCRNDLCYECKITLKFFLNYRLTSYASIFIRSIVSFTVARYLLAWAYFTGRVCLHQINGLSRIRIKHLTQAVQTTPALQRLFSVVFQYSSLQMSQGKSILNDISRRKEHRHVVGNSVSLQT